MTVSRYDRAPIKATKDRHGFLRDTPILSRVGIFEYRTPDGKVRKEYRPAEEVFKAEHLDSILGAPITEDHHGLITAVSAKGKVIGSAVSKGRQDAEHVVADIVIHDTTATTSKKELSLGYTLDLVETPGEFNGERYDAIQTNLSVNHIAVVMKGRAGNARLNLDAADAVLATTEEEPTMTTVLQKVRLDSGLEYDAAPEIAIALATAQAAVKTQKDRADAAQAALDTANAKIATHDAALAQARTDAANSIAQRVKLESEAKEIGAKFAQDAKDADIRVAVIKNVRGDAFDLAGKSEGYIDACYDLALADARKAKANAASGRATVNPPPNGRQDAAPASAQTAREKMIAAMTQPAKAGA